MNNRFRVAPKEDKTITMTIRIDKTLQAEYDKVSKELNWSRNELIGRALRFALDNIEFVDKE